MPTKAGKLKFKEIKQGVVGYVVDVCDYEGRLVTQGAQRAEFTQRPFPYRRSIPAIEYVTTYSPFPGFIARRKHREYACRYDLCPLPLDLGHAVGHSRIFKTRRAAERYIVNIRAEIVDSDAFYAMKGVAALGRQIVRENAKKPWYAQAGVRL